MRYTTVDIKEFSQARINDLLRINCDNGWEFLGFGQTENLVASVGQYGARQKIYFASFRNVDESKNIEEPS